MFIDAFQTRTLKEAAMLLPIIAKQFDIPKGCLLAQMHLGEIRPTVWYNREIHKRGIAQREAVAATGKGKFPQTIPSETELVLFMTAYLAGMRAGRRKHK